MQNFLKIILIIFVFASCSKDNNEKFIASTELNGETLLHFDAVFRKSDDGLFTLFLSKDSELGPEHRLNFYNIEKEAGRSSILSTSEGRDKSLPHSSFSSLKYQRDVLLEFHQNTYYELMDSWIEIKEIGYRKIEGSFQVVMKSNLPVEPDNPYYPYLTDTIF